MRYKDLKTGRWVMWYDDDCNVTRRGTLTGRWYQHDNSAVVMTQNGHYHRVELEDLTPLEEKRGEPMGPESYMEIYEVVVVATPEGENPEVVFEEKIPGATRDKALLLAGIKLGEKKLDVPLKELTVKVASFCG